MIDTSIISDWYTARYDHFIIGFTSYYCTDCMGVHKMYSESYENLQAYSSGMSKAGKETPIKNGCDPDEI